MGIFRGCLACKAFLEGVLLVKVTQKRFCWWKQNRRKRQRMRRTRQMVIRRRREAGDSHQKEACLKEGHPKSHFCCVWKREQMRNLRGIQK